MTEYEFLKMRAMNCSQVMTSLSALISADKTISEMTVKQLSLLRGRLEHEVFLPMRERMGRIEKCREDWGISLPSKTGGKIPIVNYSENS